MLVMVVHIIVHILHSEGGRKVLLLLFLGGGGGGSGSNGRGSWAPPLSCKVAATDATKPSLALPYADKARPLAAPHAVGEGVDVRLLSWLPVADVAGVQQRGAGLYGHVGGGAPGLVMVVWLDLRRYGRRRRIFRVCVREVVRLATTRRSQTTVVVFLVLLLTVLPLVVRVQRPEPLARGQRDDLPRQVEDRGMMAAA